MNNKNLQRGDRLTLHSQSHKEVHEFGEYTRSKQNAIVYREGAHGAASALCVPVTDIVKFTT